MVSMHESDGEETMVEVFSSPPLEEVPSSDSEGDPDPVTPDMCAERYTSLVHIHRARPDIPMRAIFRIADCLSLPWHDDQWCLGPGMPVAAIPWGCSSSRWCLSGWILDPDDQEDTGLVWQDWR